ncbi:unnamed protein product [Linum trigynum]|uniref:Retroviral polymerase SH3-like domain-containing protein n=1 Tax=Linum trigynum TaxID=586398 RepID=A0AAV2DCK6_9ROSI
MLLDFDCPKFLWAEAVNTAWYVLNRTTIRKIINKTPYEILKGKIPKLSYFHPFGTKCYILNTKDQIGKFDAKSEIGIFLGYSSKGQAYRVFNKKSRKVEESIQIKFDSSHPSLPLHSDISNYDFLPLSSYLETGETSNKEDSAPPVASSETDSSVNPEAPCSHQKKAPSFSNYR